MFEPEPPLRILPLVEHSLFAKAAFSAIQVEAEETRAYAYDDRWGRMAQWG